MVRLGSPILRKFTIGRVGEVFFGTLNKMPMELQTSLYGRHIEATWFPLVFVHVGRLFSSSLAYSAKCRTYSIDSAGPVCKRAVELSASAVLSN